MRITPARCLKGNISLPGDKSISHRAAIIAALASGKSHLSNFSTSLDCASTLECLAELGVRVERNGNEVIIHGVGVGGFSAPKGPLDCGNSGSTMRMLAGALAGHSFSATLTGDESLRGRPMRRIIEPLEMMGATFASASGNPPLRLTGHHPLKAITYDLRVASAQLKSCVLLAGLHANGRTEVVERLGATRDHTERMLRWFGVDIETTGINEDDISIHTCSVKGPASFAGRDVQIPGDFSSGAFLIAAAALLPTSDLIVERLGLNQTRTQLLDVLGSLGADIKKIAASEVCNEMVGTLHVMANEPRTEVRGQAFCVAPSPSGFLIEGQVCAALIDELPLVAVIGTQNPGGLVIRDAGELRHKETDRITATVANLRAMGAEVEEFEDGLKTNGPVKLQGAALNSFGDHRIAMAFTVAALLADGESELSGSECVAISFPEFFEILETVVER